MIASQVRCMYIRENYPQHILVLDAKRGDVSSTAEHYAREAFVRYNADAVTVNPYLGTDSVEPFLRYEGRATLILCRTWGGASAATSLGSYPATARRAAPSPPRCTPGRTARDSG